MPKYEVTLWEKVTHTVTVEADSRDGAADMAEERVCESGGMDEDVDTVSQGYSARIVTELEPT